MMLELQFGTNDIGRLSRLLHHKFKLQSKIDKSKGSKKRNMKKAWVRLKNKIDNLVKDAHCKLAKYLCSNYGTIILPCFDSGQCCKKLKSKKIKNKLRVWCHGKFRERLLNKAKEFRDCNVIITTEEFTSKTCTRCGVLNNTLGSSKVFNCKSCNLVLDRDLNGARNIFLKYLTETNLSLTSLSFDKHCALAPGV